MREPEAWRPEKVFGWCVGWVVVCVFLLGLALPGSAQARGKRCVSNRDCPSDQICLQRQCKPRPRFRVDLQRLGTQAYKIAIAPLRWIGPSKKMQKARRIREIAAQLHENFSRMVGTFQVLSRKSFLERPPFHGIELGTFHFNPWQKIGASGLIKVAIRIKGKKQVLQMRFYDVDASRLVVRKDKAVTKKNLRWTINAFCNEIYKHLLKRPGLFTTQIAYVRKNAKKGKDIWVMDFDGRNHRRVVSNGALNLMPRWTPDGRSLVFVSYMTGRPYLYRLDFGTNKITRLTYRKGTYTEPSISHDGKRITFGMTKSGTKDDADIYATDINGRGLTRLTTSWGIDTSPTWSSDSKFIAFVSERFSAPQIFVMDANGGNQTRVTFRGDYNQEPRWSPKEPEVLFTARDEFLKYDLFVIRMEKDEAGKWKPKYRRLTQNQGNNYEATWSPDGRFILFVSTRYGERKLFIMNQDGSKQRLFYRGRGDFETPAWSPPLKRMIVPSIRNYYVKTQLFSSKKREEDAERRYAALVKKQEQPVDLRAAAEKKKVQDVYRRAKTAHSQFDSALSKADAVLKKQKAMKAAAAKAAGASDKKKAVGASDKKKPVVRKPEGRKKASSKPADRKKGAKGKPPARRGGKSK